MKWRKLGLVFCPNNEYDWMQTHAAVPIADLIEGDLYKIYFSTRDINDKSYTGYIVIDLNQPQKILELSSKPVLSPGNLGAFDDSGAMATWLVNEHDKKYLYYIGWNLGVTVPFRNSIGLAISSDTTNYKRVAKGPIIDRSMTEPYFCASCCIHTDNNLWRMWYLSCTEWKKNYHKPEHSYHIKYATSADGINWERKGIVAIDYENSNEYAISRPSVIKDDNIWKMWFSSRGGSYRIRYAESADGIKWTRYSKEKTGIDVSSNGWDSEMIEYPFVFDHKGTRYMLYNGNGFGKTGLGLAVLE